MKDSLCRSPHSTVSTFCFPLPTPPHPLVRPNNVGKLKGLAVSSAEKISHELLIRHGLWYTVQAPNLAEEAW